MPRKIRPIRIDGNVAYVPLTKRYEAIIDAADVPLVEGWNWKAQADHRGDGSLRTVYAARGVRIGGLNKEVKLHRVILGAPDGMECDHINGDGLDNRRGNLRLVTRSQNGHNRRIGCNNSSGVKGVCWHRQSGKWQARIMTRGRQRQIGLFPDIASAAAAYAAASAEHHGEFGRVE